MLVVGLAFVLFALLLNFLGLSVVASAFVVGIGFVIIALLLGERWPVRS